MNLTQLFSLETKDVASDAVCQTFKSTKDIGLQQYKSFVTECLVERERKLSDTIKKN